MNIRNAHLDARMTCDNTGIIKNTLTELATVFERIFHKEMSAVDSELDIELPVVRTYTRPVSV